MALEENLRVLFEHSDGRKEYLTENIAPYGETVEIFVCGVALLGAVIVTGLMFVEEMIAGAFRSPRGSFRSRRVLLGSWKALGGLMLSTCR